MNKKIAPFFALMIIAAALLFTIFLRKNNNPQHSPSEESATIHAPQPNAPINLPVPTPSDQKKLPETRYTIPEFEAFTQKFQTELPPMKEIRMRPEHSIHPGLITAYSRSGKIARAAIDQPELRDIAFSTLESCANLDDYDTSVRAMCLRQHRKIRDAMHDHSFDEKKHFKYFKELNSLLRRSFEE